MCRIAKHHLHIGACSLLESTAVRKLKGLRSVAATISTESLWQREVVTDHPERIRADEAGFRRLRSPRQNDVSCLHQQGWDITITALGDTPEDRPVRSPVDICRGTSPNQALRSRPLAKPDASPPAATMALEIVGPIPGTVISRWQQASWSANCLISSVRSSIHESSQRQSAESFSIIQTIIGGKVSSRDPRIVGSARRSDPGPLATPRSISKPRIWLKVSIRCAADHISPRGSIAHTKVIRALNVAPSEIEQIPALCD